MSITIRRTISEGYQFIRKVNIHEYLGNHDSTHERVQKDINLLDTDGNHEYRSKLLDLKAIIMNVVNFNK